MRWRCIARTSAHRLRFAQCRGESSHGSLRLAAVARPTLRHPACHPSCRRTTRFHAPRHRPHASPIAAANQADELCRIPCLEDRRAFAPRPTAAHSTGVIAMPASRAIFWLLTTMCLVQGSGCASIQNPDPFEPVNRKVFAFNEGVDHAVLRPTAQAYVAVVPAPVRTGISNVFANSQDLWSAANLLLQGQGIEGSREAGRFGTNSTVGILGIFDVATQMGFDRHGE